MSDNDEHGIQLELAASIGLEVGKILDHRDRKRDCQLARPMAAAPVDGNGWIVWPPCAEGKIWRVRRICVMNVDPWTLGVTNSLAAVCIGQADSGTVKYTEIRQAGTNIPFIGTYGFDELPVKTGEQLYIIIHGGGGKEFATADVSESDMPRWE